MGNVTTIGLDLAKNVFEVHGVDAKEVAVVRQRRTRGRMLTYFAKLMPGSAWLLPAAHVAAPTGRTH